MEKIARLHRSVFSNAVRRDLRVVTTRCHDCPTRLAHRVEQKQWARRWADPPGRDNQLLKLLKRGVIDRASKPVLRDPPRRIRP